MFPSVVNLYNVGVCIFNNASKFDNGEITFEVFAFIANTASLLSGSKIQRSVFVHLALVLEFLTSK